MYTCQKICSSINPKEITTFRHETVQTFTELIIMQLFKEKRGENYFYTRGRTAKPATFCRTETGMDQEENVTRPIRWLKNPQIVPQRKGGKIIFKRGESTAKLATFCRAETGMD